MTLRGKKEIDPPFSMGHTRKNGETGRETRTLYGGFSHVAGPRHKGTRRVSRRS